MKMKQILMLLFIMFFLNIAIASAATNSAEGKLTLDASPAPLIVGLSPKVQMYQVTNGTAITTSQWFAISSGHPGGNRCYGTAQDVNNIYYQDYTTAAELSDYLTDIPTDDTASDTWAAAWEM
jgi:hypothetical protein